jgi:hypothetical protein
MGHGPHSSQLVIVLFYVLFVSTVVFYVLFVSIVLFCVLFVCKCVLYYCHRVATQLQLNISYQINISCHVNESQAMQYVCKYGSK